MLQKKSARDIVATHPRLLGVLFTLCILLMQFGTVLAGGGANNGP